MIGIFEILIIMIIAQVYVHTSKLIKQYALNLGKIYIYIICYTSYVLYIIHQNAFLK